MVVATEEWRATVGFDGYEVSDLGRIRSRRSGRVLSPFKRGPAPGYLEVNLIQLGQRRPAKVHVLVAAAFHGSRPVGLQIRHLDGDRRNNAAANLRYGTAVENVRDAIAHGTFRRGEDHANAKLDVSTVAEIRRQRARGVGLRELGERFGVHPRYVSLVASGRRWAHVGEGAAA